MAKFTKVAALLTALTTVLSLGLSSCGDRHTHDWKEESVTAATCSAKGVRELVCACGEHKTEEIQIDENAHDYEWTVTKVAADCETAGTKEGVCKHDPEHKTTETYYGDHKYEWTLVKEATCTEDGEKTGVCSVNASHTTTATIEKRGHDYGNNGVCSRCEMEAELPEAETSPTYKTDYTGAGEAFNRYQVKLGYYEFEITSDTEGTWIALSVDQPGQYAMYSTDGNANCVTATRFDASDHYIPMKGDGTYVGFESKTLDDGNFLSTVDCTSQYWGTNWRATWRLMGEIGDTVRVRFVRLGDEAWAAQNVYETVIPKEINGKKAEEGSEIEELVVVPYESEYFFDETVGYYRMGTKESPGEIIYVLLTKTPERQFTAQAFSTIQNEGNNLSLFYKEDVDGNYLLKYYAPFIMASESEDGNCYENYVNSDGAYPVTQELYEFLQLYANKNRPADIPDEIWDDKAARAESAWLAPCYYYTEITEGSKIRPFKITSADFGTEITVTTKALDYVYYTLETNENVSLRISSTNENIRVIIGETDVKGECNFVFEASSETKTSFRIGSSDGTEQTVTFKIEVVPKNE